MTRIFSHLLLTFCLLAALSISCSDEATNGTVSPEIQSPFDQNPQPLVDTSIAVGTDSSAPADTSTPDTADQTDTVIGAEDPYGIPDDPEEGEFGWPCTDNSECNKGFCVQTAAGKVCTQTCLENCPPSWVCSEVTQTGADTTYICKPKYLHLCDPCSTNTDCNDGAESAAKCLEFGNAGSFCGVDCTGGIPCPVGYTCQAFAGPAGTNYEQCVPANGSCECSPLAESLGLSTACYLENNLGSCEGTRFCVEGQGLLPCQGDVPQAEICDAIDNNCDGITDNLEGPQTCDLSNEHGTCEGTLTCAEGVQECTGQEPVPEICDGLDNDCDGIVDEDLCDDGDACTADSCTQVEEELVCNHAIDNTLLCDDGDVCTQTDKCEDGACVGYNPQICDDANVCTDDICDPTVGCLTQFNTAPCEDGNACTEGDTCLNGSCQAGGQSSCDDGNPCTSDACDPATGCSYSNSDGTGCTTNDSECPAGICSGGNCNIIPNQTCLKEGTICSSDVPGKCTTSGECVPTAEGGCSGSGCTDCDGICVCCKLGGFLPVSVCLPF